MNPKTFFSSTLLISTLAIASPFPEDNNPAPNYGCSVYDQNERIIMNENIYFNEETQQYRFVPLTFNQTKWQPTNKHGFTLNDMAQPRIATLHYQNTQNETLTFRRQGIARQHDGVKHFSGTFDYLKNNQRQYRGKLRVECGA